MINVNIYAYSKNTNHSGIRRKTSHCICNPKSHASLKRWSDLRKRIGFGVSTCGLEAPPG